MTNDKFLVAVASFALFAAILLGDARQSVVDVFMAGAVIAGYFTLWKTGGLRILPRAAVLLWAAVLVVGFPLFWPDALGAAIQSYVRYLFGFMVFGLVYAVSTRRASEIFESALLVVGVFVSIVATMFLFAVRPIWLPPMNLLYPSYGHNHAADILLFVVPILMYRKASPLLLRIFLWVVILSGLVFSFARGAWLLMAVYAIGVSVVVGGKKRKLGALVAGVFLVVFLVVAGINAGPRVSKISDSAAVPRVIVRFMNKGSVLTDPRLEYWGQATRMIRERPLFGSGPGSFYYGSRRLQSHPGAFSWFTHSFPLQTLAEQGVVGAMPVFFLFGWVVWRLIRFIATHHPEQDALARLSTGALLAVVYSFIEFNLSFAVVWAVFWAIAGMVLGAEHVQNQRMKNSAQFMFPVVFLVGFYLLFIGQSLVFSFFPNHARVAFYLTPFDAATTQHYLHSDTVTSRGIYIATMFHKTDTETQQAIANAWQRLGQPGLVLDTRKKVMWLDPLIEENHKAYLELLIQLGKHEEATRWFTHYPRLFFPANTDTNFIKFSVPPAFVKDRAQEVSKLFDSRYAHEVRYSRFYYSLGLWHLPTESEKTRQFWSLASLLQPKLSHLWLERATLEKHVFYNHEAATAILAECLNIPSAAEHCSQALLLQQLSPPGSLQKDINEK